MHKILIFSDTHGSIDDCIDIINSEKSLDAVIHAGDCARDAEDLISIFPDIPIHYVSGNNDWYTSAPLDLLLKIGGKNIFVTHGHEYKVKYEYNLKTLSNKANQHNADLVIFGHTHKPQTEYIGKMILLNPGSVRFTRTYAEAVIDGNEIKTRIAEI